MKFSILLVATTLTFSQAWAQRNEDFCQVMTQLTDQSIRPHVITEEKEILSLLNELVPKFDQKKLDHLKAAYDLEVSKTSPRLSKEEEQNLGFLSVLSANHPITPKPTTEEDAEWIGTPITDSNRTEWLKYENRSRAYSMLSLRGITEDSQTYLDKLKEKQKKELERTDRITKAEADINLFFNHSLHEHLKNLDKGSASEKQGKVIVEGTVYTFDRQVPGAGENITIKKEQGKQKEFRFSYRPYAAQVVITPSEEQNAQLNDTLKNHINDKIKSPVQKADEVLLRKKGIKNLHTKTSRVEYEVAGVTNGYRASGAFYEMGVTRPELISKLLPEECQEQSEKVDHISDKAREDKKDTSEGGFFKRLFGGGKASKQ